MEKTTVTFGYGAILPSLEEQANNQGFTLGKEAEFLEGLRKARTMLKFHVLTDSQTNAITQKIHKLVMRNLKPMKEAHRPKGSDSTESAQGDSPEADT